MFLFCSDDSKKNLLWRTRSALSGASCLSHLYCTTVPETRHLFRCIHVQRTCTVIFPRRPLVILRRKTGGVGNFCSARYYNLFVISLRPSWYPLLWHRTSQRRRSEYPRESKQTRQIFFSGPYRSPLHVSNMQQSAPYLRMMP